MNNFYDPADAYRKMLSEEYEAEVDGKEEITEEEDDGLDWSKEIWVKQGGGTWQAKQLKKRALEHAREIIKMAKEDRFAPSKAYTLFAYIDTLYDFVNGDDTDPDAREDDTIDAPETPEVEEEVKESNSLAEMNKSNKFFDL